MKHGNAIHLYTAAGAVGHVARRTLQLPTQEGCLWTEEIEAAEEGRIKRVHEWAVMQPMNESPRESYMR